MEFSSELQDNVIYGRFSGNIMFEHTGTLDDYLDGLLKAEAQEIIIDLSEVSGINSSAIGKIIDFHTRAHRRGRSFRIKGMSEKAYSVFKYFKLDELFPIER